MSTPQNTNQETAAQGSYLSIAASITAKFKCCLAVTETTSVMETNTHARNTGRLETPKSEPEEDAEIATDLAEPQ